MLAKEASLRWHGKEWDEWKARTGFFVPYLPALVADIFGSGLTRSSACLVAGDDAEKKA
jgi:hypothetical protein